MGKLLQWFKPSMEGVDGRASARSLTNLWYVILNTAISICIIVMCFQVLHQEHPNEKSIEAIKALTNLCMIFNIVILIIFGIVSIQQVNEGIRAFRGQQSTETKAEAQIQIKTEDEKTPINTTTSTATDS